MEAKTPKGFHVYRKAPPHEITEILKRISGLVNFSQGFRNENQEFANSKQAPPAPEALEVTETGVEAEVEVEVEAEEVLGNYVCW